MKTTARFSTNSENGKSRTAGRGTGVPEGAGQSSAARKGADHGRHHPEPHITINYRGDRLGSQTFGALKLPPIGWTVDEIILTESIVGKTTHVEHGRWLLGGT
ncbi:MULTISPECIES: hypothetical protein [unclassified Sphingopyxis]|uniref:hypothetical protein n=1 Tax=unclassified Sphingopyxis TaxID=2614943 RepID=UPI00285A4915|nr:MULTISPECIES: hypothetical protein [unclassified Sphingopyxis]MDR6833159.1 hypothetical protein [Sphingopyxis sp. BE122]MDR7228902.1 hypothetical protein [Sphingopyxis sp. BE259]